MSKVIPIVMSLLVFSIKSSGFAQDASATTAPSPRSSVEGFQWPQPTGWRTETIPFPLEFAPDIQHRGIVEVRFSPGFKDPAAEGFWSYAFVWWLQDDLPLTREALADELTRYYFGLSKAVGGDKYDIRAEAFETKLKDEVAANPYSSVYSGTIESFDPFKTGKPIRLNVRILVGSCKAAKRHFVLVVASPQPVSGAIWVQLSQVADSFRCAASVAKKEK